MHVLLCVRQALQGWALCHLCASLPLANRTLQVFSGPGSVRFQASAGTPEFAIWPEWWAGASFSDSLDLIAGSCAAARCLVVLTKSYGLRRPWRITPNLLPW